MDVQKRISLIRTIQKIKKQPEHSYKLGIKDISRYTKVETKGEKEQ